MATILPKHNQLAEQNRRETNEMTKQQQQPEMNYTENVICDFEIICTHTHTITYNCTVDLQMTIPYTKKQQQQQNEFTKSRKE